MFKERDFDHLTIYAANDVLKFPFKAGLSDPCTNFSEVSKIPTNMLPVSGDGTVALAQTICSGTIPADITLTGNIGTIIHWQHSTDAGFTDNQNFWPNVTASTLNAPFQIGSLTSDT